MVSAASREYVCFLTETHDVLDTSLKFCHIDPILLAALEMYRQKVISLFCFYTKCSRIAPGLCSFTEIDSFLDRNVRVS